MSSEEEEFEDSGSSCYFWVTPIVWCRDNKVDDCEQSYSKGCSLSSSSVRVKSTPGGSHLEVQHPCSGVFPGVTISENSFRSKISAVPGRKVYWGMQGSCYGNNRVLYSQHLNGQTRSAWRSVQTFALSWMNTSCRQVASLLGNKFMVFCNLVFPT